MAGDRRRSKEEARFRRIVVHDDPEEARETRDAREAREAREREQSARPPGLNLPDRSQDVRDLIVRISKVRKC